MRRLYSILLFSLLVLAAFVPQRATAQYGNEWIDFSKTYWKFKVGTEGIFRISKSALDVAGVPASATGSDYVLYRDGKELAVYVSNNGSFGSSDFIEFYGRGTDGQMDKELYLGPDKYTNDNTSLFYDTASYFLTVDNSKAHLRFTAITTAIPGAPPAASPYCWNKVMANGTNFLPGKTTAPVDYTSSSIVELYSSQFDNGEGFILTGYNSNLPANITLTTPNLVTGSTMSAHLRTASIGVARDSMHKLKLNFNGVEKANVTYGISDIQRFDLYIPSTELVTNNTLNFTHYLTGISDAFFIPFWDIEYPRDWNFNGLNFFKFSVEPSASAQYIEVLNFNHGGIAPKLYDLSNNKWYSGDISVSGKTRFYIDASLTRTDMVLYANTSSKIYNANFAKQETFTDYTAAANQGNYLIITHPNLRKLNGGKDYIQEYKNYRSSVAGGAYSVVVADVEELYDQYAYGVYTHPLSISRFINFALNKWSTKPSEVFLIGKGVTYDAFRSFSTSTKAKYFEGIVPTYGSPGADAAFVTSKTTWKMSVNIGRVSVWNTTELATYLNKVKAYEAALAPASFPSPATELWKKRVLHVAGGNGLSGDPYLQSGTLLPALNNAGAIIAGPKTGGLVTTIAKNTKGLPTPVEDNTIDSLISNGLSMITYYGHGSTQSFDYNIKSPSEFSSLPKIPIFSAFGCDISVIYGPDTAKTISETYIGAPNSGSIAYLASNNQGWTNIHSRYIPILYSEIAQYSYAQSLGTIYRASHDSFMSTVPIVANQTSFEYTHMESFILQGDPAVHGTFGAPKPDYYVGTEGLTTTPTTVSTAVDSFKLNINSYNLGKVFADTVQIKVEHIDPSGKTTTIRNFTIKGLANSNSTTIWVNLDKTKDIGINKYRVTIDALNAYDEISEANNTAIIDVPVLSDNIVPIYPYNFSIVYNSDLTLKASTLNPFKGLSKYHIEIDTTELFNSPSKLQTVIESKGGVIRWKPSLVMQDSVVYYWRTSLDTLVGGAYVWTNSSFIYLKNGSAGWNQSHYFQYKYNTLDTLVYPASRIFQYTKSNIVIENKNTVMTLPPPYVFYNSSANNRVYRNGADIQRNECGAYGGSLQVFVFDTSTGMPQTNPLAGGGLYGSIPPCADVNTHSFSFDISTSTGRESARKFLDAIPNGNYVFVRNHINYNLWTHKYVAAWKADTLITGSGVSLYHSMLKLGFNQIDSFNQLRLFSMICKKGYTDYTIRQDFSKDTNELIDISYTFPITDVHGQMNGITVGPASNWKTLKWRTSTYFDTASVADSSSVRIWGIDNSENVSLLYEGPTRDTNLSFISAATYPKLKLQWYNRDTVYHTAPQLNYWRILYDPLPEAALDPAAYYSFTDSVNVGQLMSMETAIETLTELPMDSMLVRYKVIDANGLSHLLADKKYKKLNGNDSLHTAISFDPKPYPGKNYLFIEANPDNNQPEQYHPNNIGYIPFTIQTDQYNPVLDVTFDGTHILDRDIISSKPFIKVLLHDENKFLALNDTNSLKLYMRYPDEPDNTRNRIAYDGSTCKFIPADMSAGKNEAFIEFRPNFAKDGIYQLYAKGQDGSGNKAGAGNEYSISFEVINKSTITHLLNYPNPFSTSTAFVFTLTGSQIPTQFKIQILSVTGKVVREITRQELGDIHIGRNVTEYKWDGKDQYGQVLGNGVYLYRVVTAINGENIEQRNSGADKFYKNGYSKMYIMR